MKRCLGLESKSLVGLLGRLRNDLYCVEWGVKLYSLTLGHLALALIALVLALKFANPIKDHDVCNILTGRPN